MREILMDKTEFRNIIENCIEYIFDDCTEKERWFYWKELYDILRISDEGLRWAELITSGIFHDAIGEWERTDNFKVWVNEEY